MFKKLLVKLWNDRDQFLRYFASGITAFVLDMATLYFFKEYLMLSAVVSVVLNQILIIIFLFLVNKYFSFKAKGDTQKQIIKFFLVMILNYLIAVLWMWVWNDKMGYNYLIVRFVNIALSVSWNFLLYKFWVYRG